MIRLCDAHVHHVPKAIAENSTFYQGAWTCRKRLRDYLDMHEIERALITYPTTDADLRMGGTEAVCQAYNGALEAIVREDGRLLMAGLVDPGNRSGLFDAVRRLKERGFAAIGVSSSHEGRFWLHEAHELFEAAETHRLPIFVHSQTMNPIGSERVNDPLLLPVLQFSMDVSMCLGLLVTSGVLGQHDVKLVFPSLGGVLPYLKERLDRVYSMLRGRGLVKDLGSSPSRLLKNVYVDAAGTSVDNVRMALDLFGGDHVLFGSDYPAMADLRSQIDGLNALEEPIRRKICCDNFQQVFVS